jgi:3-oxoacyl-[acyl-carrier protein] reductase
MANHPKRVALVTGGRHGLGREVAAALAESGFNVAVRDVCPSPELAEAVAALEQCGANVLTCEGDIASSAERQAIIDAVRARLGRLDVLVSIADGDPSAPVDILEISEEGFDRAIDGALKGPFFLAQLAARWMVEQLAADGAYRGAIINITTTTSTEQTIAHADYCIIKAGVAMATHLWAHRLAEHGVAAYDVRAGVGSDSGSPAARDIGRAVATLVRGEIPAATGNVLHIDGGMTLRRL